MKIAISGGTGFIGTYLSTFFIQKGHMVYILTRNKTTETSDPNLQYVQWTPNLQTFPLSSIDVVINLAGESINSRWTKKQKKAIVNSRIQTTKGLIKQLQTLSIKPHTFINASAIGYYGTSETESFTEQHETPGDDFLANTVCSWEQEASKARSLGIRTVYARFGVVLSADGGALPKMLLPYQFYIGGTIGSGNQWLSWIHIDDVVRLIDFIIHKKEIDGPLNITAPEPIRMKEFGETIATIMKKPHWLPVPSFILHALLGEMSILVLEGQHVLPSKAIEHGYQYTFPTIDHALQNILSHTM
ncbi:TPA: TIGR01777 family oxidoreductase [Bacillus cereus]|uniref:NAD dependent epimerase/dehydratase family protein n=1 Tax=Bacillus cereus 03BB108 TaxID=451709 RepID=A0AAN0T1R1_BACCE|nr:MULTISPECIES: TIGR01777 family oxidoreductase [Bacillus cereus group]AEW53669.1 Cell division inhibitor [Bacillus cereus F837/76]AJG59856.1 NAD dependent epimerase/dehydratase family protein [Bacillus cereus D17]AJI13594.1 NAD dependent epimerase/dehydratase family protein [Bacillus cereus 03BB108]EDX62563.1 cell division inhibitor-like protein [Bacillus cereus 03BB108]KXY96566.1 epimerase [Bacillus cereus]